jgi:hypothetical protein
LWARREAKNTTQASRRSKIAPCDIKLHQIIKNRQQQGARVMPNQKNQEPNSNHYVAGLALAMVSRLAATIDDQT